MGKNTDALRIDFETRSDVDLKERGIYNYASDISTQIIMMGWAFNDEPVKVWLPDHPFPQRIIRHIKTEGTLYAFNAQFERLVWAYILTQDFEGIPNPTLRQWKCTAAQVRIHGLPGNLKDVGRCLDLQLQKMSEGQRLLKTYSFPGHEKHIPPDDLALMVDYCATDVEVERALSLSLREPTDDEWEVFWANEEINDRGLPIDTQFTRAAMKYGEAVRKEADGRIVKITGGQVANARARKTRDEWLRTCLTDEHLEILSDEGKIKFGKPRREELLLCEDLDEDVREFTVAVEEAGGATISKYEAFTHRSIEGRLCGALLFSGGGQTGRFSSLGVQVHNLKRDGHKDPEKEIGRILANEVIDAPSEHLAKLIRAAIYHPDGLVWADYSNIEGRVAPWLANSLAGERKLDMFRRGLDPYKVNAAQMYSVQYEEVTGEQRQAGKVAELACLGPDTQVLTQAGFKRIIEISTADKLWDGEEWVTHRGLISRGKRTVLNLDGLKVTPDHLVKTPQTWRQASQLASNKQLLFQAQAMSLANLPSSVYREICMEPVTSTTSSFSVLAAFRNIKSIFTTCLTGNPPVARYAPEKRLGSGVKTFMGTPIFAQTLSIADGYSIASLRPLRDAHHPITPFIGITVGEELKFIPTGWVESLVSAISWPIWSRLRTGTYPLLKWIESMLTGDTNRGISVLYQRAITAKTSAESERYKTELLNLKQKMLTYDIAYAGPRNCFTVKTDSGTLLVHNCGFLGGAGALLSMAKMFKMTMSRDRAEVLRDAWRSVNSWAVPYGSDLVQAAKLAYYHPNSWFEAGRIAYGYDGQMWLWCRLPSGRLLAYLAPKMELVKTPWGDEMLSLTAVWTGGKPKKGEAWPRRPLTPGLLLENSTQATAACLLRRAIVKAVNAGIEVVGHVHDEVIAQNTTEEALLTHLLDAPDWAEGLPIEAVASSGTRYGK